jgi:hypothetical protein
MTAVLREYLETVSSGDYESAHALLTDSLGSGMLPAYLLGLSGSPSAGALELVHWETRGFLAYLRLEEGGTRALWLSREDGGWRISGDTSLDNLLGRAASACRTFAVEEAVPSIEAGVPAGEFRCPVTGEGYSVDSVGRLTCPAGHLGQGLDLSGDRCAALRDSLALVVAEFVVEGRPLPGSFTGLYEESGGRFGQPGGFRCPDHGYSYLSIEDGAVHCPWHGESSVIPAEVP